MKTLSVTFYIQRERSPHRPQMQLRPAPLCPISLKTLMVQIQLVVITMMKMKRKHLTSESVQKTAWFELQDFSLYPYIKKLYSEKMEANYDCQKSNKSPLMYCQLQDSSFQQVELPGLAQNDLLWPGLLNQDACSTSKICCWTLGNIIDVPQLVPRASTTSQGQTMIVVPKMTH